jgi:hypothetical protein
MSAPGRNDPCPCGSGRKYKQCCLLRATQAVSAREYLPGERVSAIDAVRELISRAQFASDVEAAETVFVACMEAVPDSDDPGVVEDSGPFFQAWLMFDFELRPGRTAVDLCLDRQPSGLRSGERRYLELVRETTLRPYEVAAVRPGEGLDLVDLWTGDRVQVRERAASEQIVPWMLLGARIMPGDDGVPVIEGPIYPYPQTLREPMLKELKREHRRQKRANPDIAERDFFRATALTFHLLWLEHVRVPPMPQMVTPERDPIVFARVVFDVHDHAALRAALDARADLHRQDADSYVWLGRARKGARRSLGTIVLHDERLVFEALSRPRAKRGQAMIEALAGPAATYRATSFEGVEQAIAREGEHPRRAPVPEVPAEVQAEVIGKFLEQHYSGWLDHPLPALDGRTPRAAAKLKAARPKLISLLKHMESMAEHDRRQGRPAYDFGWMWAELELERPQ